jgi:hypothetical protein
MKQHNNIEDIMKSLFCIILLSSVTDSSIAQLQVRNEPRHKNVFENKWIRVLDVKIKPGDTTLFHRHSTPSVIVLLTNTKLGTELQGGEPVISHTKSGSLSYAAYGEKPIFHRVWNDDTSEFHVMDIELLGKSGNASELSEGGPDFEKVWQEKMVNSYSVSLKEKESITKVPGAHPFFLINVSGRTVVQVEKEERITFDKPGQFVWIESGSALRLGGLSPRGSKLVSLELK